MPEKRQKIWYRNFEVTKLGVFSHLPRGMFEVEIPTAL